MVCGLLWTSHLQTSSLKFTPPTPVPRSPLSYHRISMKLWRIIKRDFYIMLLRCWWPIFMKMNQESPSCSTLVTLVIVLAPKERVRGVPNCAHKVCLIYIVCDFVVLDILFPPQEGRELKWAFGDAMRRARPTDVNEGSKGLKQTLPDTCVVF
jgi:hypothetical protein